MIRKVSDQRKVSRFPGVDFKILVEPEEMYDAGRLYAVITIAPGASIAFHRHENEMESFYVVKGNCRVEDNQDTAHLNVGDVMVTLDSETHSVHNDGLDPVELVALIISREQGVPGSSVAL